jgi:putative thiamine transport system ATP-binding protein
MRSDGRQGMAGELKLDKVRLRIGGQLLLAVDATVKPGQVLTVMGPSGSGKSSLLAFIAGFLAPAFDAEGRVILEGLDVTDLPAEQRRIGLLFQDPMLFPHLSVAGNLLFGIRRDVPDRRAVAGAALVQAGLAGYGTRDPATLSGGQKARVALMRLLLSQPCAVLLDEPFSKLDAGLKDEMRAYVFTSLKARGLPALLVTHDEADAVAAGGPTLRI